MKLNGKVALVTGGANGIGLAIAKRFAAEGAHVVTADIADPAQTGTNDSIVHLRGDVSEPTYVTAVIEQTIAQFGGIDVLVNCAARAGGCGMFTEVSLEDWQSYINTNLTGVFLVSQAVARLMIERQVSGSIINIGSINSFTAEPGALPYVASKGGVLMLTKAMAVDLAPHGIRANMIAPGPVRVARNADLFDSEPMRAGFAKSIPLGGQPGSGDDIAGAAVYFASDDSRFVTGTSLVIDGGATAIFRHD